jgi:D-alanine-D-alanine ligase-like ATP-grasp enzyme
MKKKKESYVLGSLLKRIAPSIGATILLEPEWKIAGQITFKSGHRSYFRFNSLDLNPMGSSAIAKDKDYANFFMKSLGYSIVPESMTFYSDEWANAIGAPKRTIDAAYDHAKRIGFPVVVKPNSGTHGRGVAVASNKVEFYRAFREVLKLDRVGLVQQRVVGRDCRLVVLDGDVISAYERTPLNVTGDGKSSILRLLEVKQEEFSKIERGSLIPVVDPRIKGKLKNNNYNLKSILAKGEKVFLLDNANLSSGGDAVDVTDVIHPDFKKLAIRLTTDMGLRLCGVDLMIHGDIRDLPKEYWIIEINSAPGLSHYATLGKKQKKIAQDLYKKILERMNENYSKNTFVTG